MSDPADLSLVYNTGALRGHQIQMWPDKLYLSLGVNLKYPWFEILSLRSRWNASRNQTPEQKYLREALCIMAAKALAAATQEKLVRPACLTSCMDHLCHLVSSAGVTS